MKALSLLCLVACASNAEIAERYANLQRDDLAFEYRCKASPPSGVVASFAAADAALQKRAADKSAKNDEEGAYVITLARVDLWLAAKACGVATLAFNDVWQKSEAQRKRATSAAMKAWDQAQIDGKRTIKEQWAALEHARLWQENDPDLEARQAALTQKLFRTVRVVGPMADAVSAAIVARRSPLIGVTTEPNASYTLTIDVQSQLDAGAQTQIERSDDDAWVDKRNRFDDVEKDDAGNTVTEKVSAHVEVYEQTSTAKVTVRYGLGAPSQTLSEVKADTKRSMRWSGDERALSFSHTSIGGDQTPPTAPERLMQQLLGDFVGRIAASVVSTIEDR